MWIVVLGVVGAGFMWSMTVSLRGIERRLVEIHLALREQNQRAAKRSAE